MTSVATSNGDGTQTIQISNPDEAIDEETANSQGGVDNDNNDKRPTSLKMVLFCMIQQSWQPEESLKALQAMYPSEWFSKL